MIALPWQFNHVEAVFVQIANRLRQEILSGKYPPGSQIPPVRALAYDAAVNPNTMQKALLCLESEGLLHAEGTVGRFVTTDEAVLTAARDLVRRETVRKLVSDAAMLGISKEELIQYIKEDNTNGTSGTVLSGADEEL